MNIDYLALGHYASLSSTTEGNRNERGKQEPISQHCKGNNLCGHWIQHQVTEPQQQPAARSETQKKPRICPLYTGPQALGLLSKQQSLVNKGYYVSVPHV